MGRGRQCAPGAGPGRRCRPGRVDRGWPFERPSGGWDRPKTALTAARGFCKLRKSWSKVRFRSDPKIDAVGRVVINIQRQQQPHLVHGVHEIAGGARSSIELTPQRQFRGGRRHTGERKRSDLRSSRGMANRYRTHGERDRFASQIFKGPVRIGDAGPRWRYIAQTADAARLELTAEFSVRWASVVTAAGEQQRHDT